MPRWMIVGCGYVTLQTLLLFLRLLERWLSITILIRLIYPKDAVSVPGISMTYVLNKSLEKIKGLELYSPGRNCHLCRDKYEELQHCSCDGAPGCGGYCEECQPFMSC